METLKHAEYIAADYFRCDCTDYLQTVISALKDNKLFALADLVTDYIELKEQADSLLSELGYTSLSAVENAFDEGTFLTDDELQDRIEEEGKERFEPATEELDSWFQEYIEEHAGKKLSYYFLTADDIQDIRSEYHSILSRHGLE